MTLTSHAEPREYARLARRGGQPGWATHDLASTWGKGVLLAAGCGGDDPIATWGSSTGCSPQAFGASPLPALDHCQDLSGMAVGFDRGPYPLNHTLFIDEKGHALHTNHSASSDLLPAPGPIGGGHAFGGVRQQREYETVLRRELGVRLHAIGANP